MIPNFLILGAKKGVGVKTLVPLLKNFYNLQVLDLTTPEVLATNISNVEGILLVLDVNDRSSLENLPSLISKLSLKYPDASIYLVGNKIDLTSKIAKEEILAITKKFNISGYFESIYL